MLVLCHTKTEKLLRPDFDTGFDTASPTQPKSPTQSKPLRYGIGLWESAPALDNRG